MDKISDPTQVDRVFEELGKEQGIWDELIDYCGDAASAEITAFRVAASESSWKRFGAALWVRGNP
jgi:hypothetical protein